MLYLPEIIEFHVDFFSSHLTFHSLRWLQGGLEDWTAAIVLCNVCFLCHPVLKKLGKAPKKTGRNRLYLL